MKFEEKLEHDEAMNHITILLEMLRSGAFNRRAFDAAEKFLEGRNSAVEEILENRRG